MKHLATCNEWPYIVMAQLMLRTDLAPTALGLTSSPDKINEILYGSKRRHIRWRERLQPGAKTGAVNPLWLKHTPDPMLRWIYRLHYYCDADLILPRELLRYTYSDQVRRAVPAPFSSSSMLQRSFPFAPRRHTGEEHALILGVPHCRSHAV